MIGLYCPFCNWMMRSGLDNTTLYCPNYTCHHSPGFNTQYNVWIYKNVSYTQEEFKRLLKLKTFW